MMMMTEVVGKGDGDESHFWSGVAPAVQNLSVLSV
jgi:hypothetical protein